MRGTSLWPPRQMRSAIGSAIGDGNDDALGFRQAPPGNGRGAVRTGLAWLGRFLHPAKGADQAGGTLPRWRQHTSGTGGADGGAVREVGGGSPLRGPDFAGDVPPGGYAWWYVDAISDDGSEALTIIAFIGSVFSPYYALSRSLGSPDPLNHCALNVALYGRRKHWALTERTRADLSRDATTLVIGPSRLSWDGEALTISIDEVTVPIPSRIRGTVRVWPSVLVERDFVLDANGRHRWQPIAPCARVEVDMLAPSLHWTGTGYLDCNSGAEPLEAAFTRWDWSRAPIDGGTAVLYDIERRDGTSLGLALRLGADGSVEEFAAPPRCALPGTLWRVARHARSEDGAPRLVKTLEDTPFYARSLVGDAAVRRSDGRCAREFVARSSRQPTRARHAAFPHAALAVARGV